MNEKLSSEDVYRIKKKFESMIKDDPNLVYKYSYAQILQKILIILDIKINRK